MIHATEGLKLLKIMAKDDVEAYLESFQRVAVLTGWNKAWWAGQLAPLLISPAQAA